MYYFNPHPTCEDNRKSSIVYLVYGDFNSHPLTGMNLCHYIATHQNLLQPTPPYGDEQKSNATNCRPRKFQPTPLQGGGERHTTNWKETIIYFNPHLPHGGWMDSWYLQTNHMITLQLTSPYGDEQEIILNWLFTVYIFQSTPPHGDELHSSMYTLLCYYFNPHPRMGMNRGVCNTQRANSISTHTPVWGWTIFR